MKRILLPVLAAVSVTVAAARPGRAFFSPPDLAGAEKLRQDGRYEEAFRAFKRLADADPAAKRMLAAMYMQGQGTAPDAAKAAALYREAGEAGDVPAQVKLGWLYFEGDTGAGIRQDRDAAFDWFRKAARQGDLRTQELLANLLFEQAQIYDHPSETRTADPKKASALKEESFKWYLAAAEKGDVEAMRGVAGLYADLGKPKLAFYWAARCAESAREKDDVRRMASTLSEIYAAGTGIPPDPAEAYKWLMIAAAYGDDSRDILQDFRSRLSQEQLSRAEEAARAWKPGQKLAAAPKPRPPGRPASPSPKPVPAPQPAPPAQPAAPAAVETPRLPAPLAPPFSLKEDADRYALVVGIEDYKSAPKAKYAERDAAAMRSYLRAMGYPERNIILLTGADASLSGILSYLEEWLPKNIGAASRLFVFYSGHGAPDPRTAEPYLVPWDGKLGYLKTTALPLARFYKDIAALKAKSSFVALDACFSGSGARSAATEGARPLVVSRQQPEGLPPGVAVLASSSEGEISVIDDASGHGLFTYQLLKSIDERAAEGRPTTAGEVFEGLAAKVSDGARRRNSEQTPRVSGDKAVPLY